MRLVGKGPATARRQREERSTKYLELPVLSLQLLRKSKTIPRFKKTGCRINQGGLLIVLLLNTRKTDGGPLCSAPYQGHGCREEVGRGSPRDAVKVPQILGTRALAPDAAEHTASPWFGKRWTQVAMQAQGPPMVSVAFKMMKSHSDGISQL